MGKTDGSLRQAQGASELLVELVETGATKAHPTMLR